MIYPILLYGSSSLRNPTENIAPDYPGLHQLISDMFDTMYHAEGVGLAAPQIGRPINLFVIDGEPFSDDDPALVGFKKVFINAEIYERTGNIVPFNEGCLSVPGIHENVLRDDTIRIRYFDEDFREQDRKFTGLAARIIQHEYDHIEGKIFTDYLPPLRKTLLKNKLGNMAKGKVRTFYKTKLDK